MTETETETSPPPFFNGGKMYHIFAFNDETKRYDPAFTSSEAEQALLHGTLYYKIDGSNGMVQVIQKEEEDGITTTEFKAFQRLDTKGKEPKDDLTPLPSGRNVSAYTGHSYYYSEITLDVQGKNQIKRNRAMLELVERHINKFVGVEWTSVEWVGSSFNATPGVPHKIALAIHKEQTVEGADFAKDFDGLRKYLLEDCADQPIEGFILEHEGQYWKVRTDCFPTADGAKDPFKANRGNTRPPVFLV